MELQSYVDEIKLQLTGYVLETEIDDDTYVKIVNSAFRELQRYISTTHLVTVPYSPCIDMSPLKINSVSRVYRANANGLASASTDGQQTYDPMVVTQWQILNGNGNIYGFQDFTYNLGAYSLVTQMRNTLSTDLAFRYERTTNKLYVNTSTGHPSSVTVEYIPRYDDVSEIVSDYWIDILVRLSVALTKVTLGRIRTRYTQSGALWTQDGETILNEGKAELDSLREHLLNNSMLIYPYD